jgi:hypothetical protein
LFYWKRNIIACIFTVHILRKYKMDGLREGYEYFVSQAGVASVIKSYGDWDQWITTVEKAIESFPEHLRSFEGSNKRVEVLAGEVAEFWHADTFNVQAALNRSTGPRAKVPRSNSYGSADATLGEKAYQLKYHKDAGSSVKALSKTFGQDAQRASAKALIDAGLFGSSIPV